MSCSVFAQTDKPFELFNKIKRTAAGSAITYDYSVALVERYGDTIDRIIGKVYKEGLNYIDSNNVTITATGNGYYFGLNQSSKTATIVAINKLEKMLDAPLAKNQDYLVGIPDSVISKHGDIKIKTLENGNYLFQLTFKELHYTNVDLEVNKKTMLVHKMKLTSLDRIEGQRRIYNIHNIKCKFNSDKLNLNRFFRIKNNEVVLDKKYLGYKINTITN